MEKKLSGYPILSCHEAAKLEASVLGDETVEWQAMKKAGVGIARALVWDYQEFSPLPENLNVLALVGKGNNGGDALIACNQLLKDFPRASVTLFFTSHSDQLKPLALRSFELLKGRVACHHVTTVADVSSIHAMLDRVASDRDIDICIDGLLGMSFRAPIRKPESTLIRAVNSFERIGLRAAVDLPSGKGDVSDELFFVADFTYATGIPKKVLFEGDADCGRIRVIDLGFQATPEGLASGINESVLENNLLLSMRALRPANANKYTFGHAFVLGGSVNMPGALLMAVQAALRSGVGLVTAFAPASVASALAAQAPEAMWVPWPENSEGHLDPKSFHLLADKLDRATVVLVGPGMGRHKDTIELGRKVIEQVNLPVILDADALQSPIMELILERTNIWGPVVLTPHTGEFARIAVIEKGAASNGALREFCRYNNVLTVLKGPYTRICDGVNVWYNVLGGGPVLARAGSGDLLAGLIAGLVAQGNVEIRVALARAVMLHAQAAQLLAQQKGQAFVHTTQLLEYLPDVLRKR